MNTRCLRYTASGQAKEKELDYVRPELSHLNESWVGDSISHRLESAKQRYFDTVGQKMQTKAAPIRGGSQYLAKKFRTVKVHLKANYQVMLYAKQQ